MSVTFSIESLPTGKFVIECYDDVKGNVVVGEADSYEGILVERAAHMLVCEECSHYGCYSKPVMDISDDFEVNLSNMNAGMILRTIGVEHDGDLCGTVEGEDFLGRVLVALAEDRDDSGVAPATVGGVDFDGTRISSGATMIDCGLRPGYMADTLGRLHALGAEAARLGRTVTFA